MFSKKGEREYYDIIYIIIYIILYYSLLFPPSLHHYFH